MNIYNFNECTTDQLTYMYIGQNRIFTDAIQYFPFNTVVFPDIKSYMNVDATLLIEMSKRVEQSQ